MPKVGMGPIRRQQLIDATLRSINELGLANTTIGSISQYAGVSLGVISHYFGGKDALLQATMHHMLKTARALYHESVDCLPEYAHYERLVAFIDANLSEQRSCSFTAKVWLSFWTHSLQDPSLRRLQRISERRLFSNLVYELRYLVGGTNARACAKVLMALMDGAWLRGAVSQQGVSVEESITFCKTCIRWMIKEHRSIHDAPYHHGK